MSASDEIEVLPMPPGDSAAYRLRIEARDEFYEVFVPHGVALEDAVAKFKTDVAEERMRKGMR